MMGAICTLIANREIFIHTHVLADGSIIVHAHPYDKSKDSESHQTHHHTYIELFLLDNLNILFLTLFAALTTGILHRIACYPFQVISFQLSPVYDANQGRAPPVA